MGLKPPNTQSSPCYGESWQWILVAYCEKKANRPKTAIYVSKILAMVLEKALLHAQLEVPGDSTHTPWSAASAPNGNRVKMVRRGQKLNGQDFSITDMINLRISVSDSVPQSITTGLKKLQHKYSEILTLDSVTAGTTIKDLAGNTADTSTPKLFPSPCASASSKSAPCSTATSLKKRPPANPKSVRKVHMKRSSNKK